MLVPLPAFFTDAQRAYLANPNSYYWAFTQEHLDRSEAVSKAWKGDATASGTVEEVDPAAIAERIVASVRRPYFGA